MSGPRMWVLLRNRQQTHHDHPDDAVSSVGVHCVCPTFDDVLAIIDLLDRKNPRYPMVRESETSWSIGPKHDEGFFGQRPMEFRAVEVSVRPQPK